MTQMNDATRRQIQAAQPGVSTWLSANAGSGKTRVLTDRVARLLLDGVSPENILCLTYTKAAATEMQNRLFKRLGAWAMRDDADLRSDLTELGLSQSLDAEALRHARTLFAKAIETPGGLKIQTIHSFCATILRRFPLEAGVSPQFKEADERSITILVRDILEKMARTPALDGVMSDLARYSSDTTIDSVLKDILTKRSSFHPANTQAQVSAEFGIEAAKTVSDHINEHFGDADIKLVNDLVPHLLKSGPRDSDAGQKLSGVRALSPQTLAIFEDVFLTKTGKNPFTAKIGTLPTKALAQGAAEPFIVDLNDLMLRVQDFRATRIALINAQRTAALHAFANEFLPRFAQEKQLRGWLDFEDLILKARDLLTNPLVAEWVLFRLDGGIDHILVDEAQDTSPAQWDVIEKLAQEFTSGQGARADVNRTIFVVGDKKQSIFGFQGADPNEFDRMRETFATRLIATNQPFQPLSLEYSFRSSAAILSLVDHTFDGRSASGFTASEKHRAFKDQLPGRVDLWPVVEKAKDVEKQDWYLPVDQRGPTDHNVILAKQIATYIHGLITQKTLIPHDDGPRPIRAGDIMILVRSRSALFQEIIRSCKDIGLPMAGADRLKVQKEMAVRDLLAFLNFLATPEDDLALAIALKSPLFGWDEQRLFDLAHKRDTKYLWHALRDQPDLYHTELHMIHDLRDKTDFLRPYDLLERILTKHNGRKRLIGRLGAEAMDAIDTLLSQALIYEQSETPSLTGFISWASADELEIKRQLSADNDEIRVMTVHGSKGLESPVVILPDTAKRDPKVKGDLLFTPDGFAMWKPTKDNMSETLNAAYDMRLEAEQQEADRLLYVALTRAEKWLIVAASGEVDGPYASWYRQIQNGMTKAGAVEHDFGFGTGLRLAHLDWPSTAVPPSEPLQERPAPSLPDWVQETALPPNVSPTHIAPSDLGGPKALGGAEGRDEDAAMRFGSQVHLLLEYLPTISPAHWIDLAPRILDHADLTAAQNELDDILSHVLPVLRSQQLAWIFAPDTFTEVGVSAHLDGPNAPPIYGIIDRLVVTDETIEIIDYKTNAIVPQSADHIPSGILRQMAAYRAALGKMYPRHQICTGILWTKTAQYMKIDDMSLVHSASEDTSS